LGVILEKNPLSRGTLGGSKIDEFGGFEGQNPGFGGQNRDFDDFGTFPWGSIRFWAFLGFFLRNGRAKNRLFGIGHFGTLGGGFRGVENRLPGSLSETSEAQNRVDFRGSKTSVLEGQNIDFLGVGAWVYTLLGSPRGAFWESCGIPVSNFRLF